MGFPLNPADGDTYELKPGIYYVYAESTKTWSKVEVATSVLATPLLDGLMSSEDLYKLNRLVLPPPQSTITSDTCDTTFNNGVLSLRSGDQFVMIDGFSALQVPNGVNMQVINQVHQHTHAFNFSIDTTTFFDYMLSSGRFVVRSPQGTKGPPGDAGIDGIDNLPYGPAGPTGDPGANAPADLSLQTEPASLVKKELSQRAIVSIATEDINSEEYRLVVTRANIGNPNARATSVRLTSNAGSHWVAAIPNFTGQAIISWLPDSCVIDSQEIYYFDIATILDAIRAEFDREVLAIKQNCEAVVAFWLNIMAALFDEQKAALCCALEYCESQSRNTDSRRYIEQQRIQAVQAQTLTGFDLVTGKFTSQGQSIVIDGDPFNSGKSLVVSTPMDPACLPGGFGSANIHNLPNNADPVGGTKCVPGNIVIDGQTIKYDECPPGFIPRSLQQSHLLTNEPYTDQNRILNPDYTLRSQDASAQSTAQAGAIDALRSNNPTTSALLKVTIAGDAQLRERVTVYVTSLDGSVTFAYGYTDAKGEIYFKNLSTADQYKVLLRKPGNFFAPLSWTQPKLVAGQVTELTSTITVGYSPSTAEHVIQGCANGPNALLIKITGDAEGVNMTWVSLKYYSTTYTLCTTYANAATIKAGEILLTGIPNGKWIVYVMTDPTAGSKPYYYEVVPPCTPPASPLSSQVAELRMCTTVEFLPQSDGGQSLQTLSFNVVRKLKSGSFFLSVEEPAPEIVLLESPINFDQDAPQVDTRAASLVLNINNAATGPHKSVSGTLEKGKYIVDIADCCIGSQGQFTGHIEVEYQILNKAYVKRFPNLGALADERRAKSGYQGLAIEIEHSGGSVQARLVTPALLEITGEIAVRFTSKDAIQQPVQLLQRQITVDGCLVQSGHIKWFEEGWRNKDCSGCLVSLAGQDYILTRREGSVGEVLCPNKFVNAFLAWPTLDGREFIGVPSTGLVVFKRVVELEGLVKSAIQAGRYTDAIGDVSVIDIVLFPTISQ